jgi:hypothetical protein
MRRNEGGGLTLAQLILNRKGSRSFDILSEDCGGTPAGRRIQQFTWDKREMKAFPDPDTIVGLAKGLAVTPEDVLLAAARSLGIPVREANMESLTIAGAGTLSPSAQEALQFMAKELLKNQAATQSAAPAEGD